jgi:hypothetical protein
MVETKTQNMSVLEVVEYKQLSPENPEGLW